MCDEWLNPFAFYEWCEDKYEKGLQLNRIDNDGDYTPDNCEFTTNRENSINRRLLNSTNTSGYKGVSWHKQAKKWRVVIKINQKQKHLGLFISKKLAALRYDVEAIKEGYQTNFLLKGSR